MKKLIFFLVIMLSSVFKYKAIAQDQDPWRVMIITGSINPSIKKYDLFVSGGGRTQHCTTWDKPEGSLCSVYIWREAKNARLEITAPGFKRYSRNIPKLEFQGDKMYFDIGQINLVKSELPQIESIIASKAVNGSTNFEITLRNPLAKEFFIRELEIMAFKAGDGSTCCCPPAAIFSVGQNLQVNAGNKLEKSTTGTFKELVRGENYSVDARGTIKRNGCDKAETLSLTLPTSFLLPSHQFTAIHIILPEHFNLQDSRYDDPEIKEKPSKNIIGNGELKRFNNYHFSFRTLAIDELEIEGSYPKN